MSDNIILTLVAAIIAILSIFGVWKKIVFNLKAFKEWIDVVHAAITTILNIVKSILDGNLTPEELKLIKKNIEMFKKELDEARNFDLKLLSFKKFKKWN